MIEYGSNRQTVLKKLQKQRAKYKYMWSKDPMCPLRNHHTDCAAIHNANNNDISMSVFT